MMDYLTQVAATLTATAIVALSTSGTLASLSSVDAPLVIATVGLVGATAVLGFYTRSLVKEAQAARVEAEKTRYEMREGRHLSVRPRLTFDVAAVGGTLGVLLIRNLGLGPALSVKFVVSFEGSEETERWWSQESFAPGESHQLNLPEPFITIKATLESPLVVRVEGRADDLYGRQLDVSAEIDVSAWWKETVAAEERIVGRDKLIDDRQ